MSDKELAEALEMAKKYHSDCTPLECISRSSPVGCRYAHFLLSQTAKLEAAEAEVERQHGIITRLHDEKASQSMDMVKLAKAYDELKAEVENLRSGPAAKAEKALLSQQETQELNRKFRIAGVSISDATIDDWKKECVEIRTQLTAAEERVEGMAEALQFHWENGCFCSPPPDHVQCGTCSIVEKALSTPDTQSILERREAERAVIDLAFQLDSDEIAELIGYSGKSIPVSEAMSAALARLAAIRKGKT